MTQRDPTNCLRDIRHLNSDRQFSKYQSRKFLRVLKSSDWRSGQNFVPFPNPGSKIRFH